MADELIIPIGARDNASDVIDPLTKKLTKLDGTEVEVELTADTGQAETRVDKVQRLIRDMSDDKAKIVLDANVAALEAKLKRAKREIVDLSDEGVKINAEVIGDGEAQLKQLKKMADDLDGTKVDIDTEPTRRGIHEVGKEADSSKSVLANMIGNTTQDLGDLGGVAGSAGVAIGQIGEYAADAALAGGSIASIATSFGAVLLPVAALSVALPLLTKLFTDQSEAEKETEAATKNLAKAYADLDSSQPSERLKALDKVITDLITDTPDLTAHIDALGIKGEDLASAATGTLVPSIERVRTESKNLNAQIQANIRTQQEQATQAGRVITAYDAEQQALEDVAKANGITVQELKNRIAVEGQVLVAVDALTAGNVKATAQDDLRRQVLGKLIGTEETATTTTEAHTKSIEDLTQALLDHNDATRAVTDSRFAYNRAAREAQQAQADLADGLKKINDSDADAATKERQRQQLYEDTAQKAIALAEAQAKLAEDQDKAAGVTTDATKKLDNYNASLLTTAASTDGPVHDALVQHIADVNGIPPEKVTEILASTPNLEEQKKLLDEASKARTATITVQALNLQKIVDDYNAVRDKNVRIHFDATGTARVHGTEGMVGTPYAPGGPMLVGEAGPETVWLPRGSKVDTAGRTLMSGLGATSIVHHVTLNVQVSPTANLVQAGREIAGALEAFYRANGSRRAA